MFHKLLILDQDAMILETYGSSEKEGTELKRRTIGVLPQALILTSAIPRVTIEVSRHSGKSNHILKFSECLTVEFLNSL